MAFIEQKIIGFAYLVVMLAYFSLANKTNDKMLLQAYILYGLGYIFFAAAFFAGDMTAIPDEKLLHPE